MKILILLFSCVLLTNCGSSSNKSGGGSSGPGHTCDVRPDLSSPARAARSAFEMRQYCSLPEEEVVRQFDVILTLSPAGMPRGSAQ